MRGPPRAAVGLLWPFRGPKGSFRGPRGLPWAPGGAQCPAGGRSILDRSLIDPKVTESVFAGDVEQNVVG